jgi:hypothetical protein
MSMVASFPEYDSVSKAATHHYTTRLSADRRMLFDNEHAVRLTDAGRQINMQDYIYQILECAPVLRFKTSF